MGTPKSFLAVEPILHSPVVVSIVAETYIVYNQRKKEKRNFGD